MQICGNTSIGKVSRWNLNLTKNIKTFEKLWGWRHVVEIIGKKKKMGFGTTVIYRFQLSIVTFLHYHLENLKLNILTCNIIFSQKFL